MKLHFRSLHIPSDWLWVRAQVPVIRTEETTGIVAQDVETGDIVGAAVFDNWCGNSVQGHFMIKSPVVLRHNFLETCLGYVFNEAGREVMLGFVPGNNEKAIRFNEHMGFEIVHVVPNGYADGVAYMIMQMRKDQCNYLPSVETGT